MFSTCRPTHRVVEKDLKFIDFSPEKELKEVMDHSAKKMVEFGK